MVLLANSNNEPYAKKFFEPIGPNGEMLLEYTIYDAIETGFNRIVMIANKDIKRIIKKPIELRFNGKIDIKWADSKRQSLFSLGKKIPLHHFNEITYSLWKAKKYLTLPFLVVDAKYYHGKRGFERAHQFLKANKEDFGSISLPLGKTLSPYGGVDRAICVMKKSGLELKKIITLRKIRNMNGAIGCLNSKKPILSDEIPATDMYCLNQRFFEAYEGLIIRITKSPEMSLKKITIPTLINFLVKRKMVKTKVLMVDSKWFGTQFKHERILAKNTIKTLIAHKLYPQDLGHALSMT